MRNLLMLAFILVCGFSPARGESGSTVTIDYSFTVMKSTFTGEQSLLNVIAQDSNDVIVANTVSRITTEFRSFSVQRMFPTKNDYSTFTVTSDGKMDYANGYSMEYGVTKCSSEPTHVTFPEPIITEADLLSWQFFEADVAAGVPSMTLTGFDVICTKETDFYWTLFSH